MPNDAISKQMIVPILRYDDARGAIRSLCAAFGFVELFSVPASGQVVRHAQLISREDLRACLAFAAERERRLASVPS